MVRGGRRSSVKCRRKGRKEGKREEREVGLEGIRKEDIEGFRSGGRKVGGRMKWREEEVDGGRKE